ncbi:MAG: ABC transporter permease [Clostridia bacterium]|nr:ABC transporter permease [Clostridia bacterium]
MRRARLFYRRNVKEILKSSFGYTCFLGFPVAVLILFRFIAHYELHRVAWLHPAYFVPSLTLCMFAFMTPCMAYLVARDFSSAYLLRLSLSPLQKGEMLLGYTLPGFTIGILQFLVCALTLVVLGWIDGIVVSPLHLLQAMLVQTPALLFFIELGILIGCTKRESVALVISAFCLVFGFLLSDTWAPLPSSGNLTKWASHIPFYAAVRLGRHYTLHTSEVLMRDVWLTLGYALASLLCAAGTFCLKMTRPCPKSRS